MGQYFKALFIRDGRATKFGLYYKPDRAAEKYLADYQKEALAEEGKVYMSAKLTEHSWVGNFLVEGIIENLIEKGPARVAWVGDYAEREDFPTELWEKNPWRADSNRIVRYKTPDKENLLDDMYIVNEDKGEYIDFNEYFQKNKQKVTYRTDTGDEESYDEALHPVPLMTAVGNGNGGGDYFGTNEDLVGKWAFNTLSIRSEKPNGLRKICPVFRER